MRRRAHAHSSTILCEITSNRFGSAALQRPVWWESRKLTTASGSSAYPCVRYGHFIFWRRGWDSNPMHGLATRKLLILKRTESNRSSELAALSYTYRTRVSRCEPLHQHRTRSVVYSSICHVNSELNCRSSSLPFLPRSSASTALPYLTCLAGRAFTP